VLRRELPKPKVSKSPRAKVVGHDDATWMSMDTWDVCHVLMSFELWKVEIPYVM
jgi:hypothetical protein